MLDVIFFMFFSALVSAGVGWLCYGLGKEVGLRTRSPRYTQGEILTATLEALLPWEE